MNCNICDIELFEATSEQGTSLFYCKNKYCEFYGKSMNTFFNMPKIKTIFNSHPSQKIISKYFINLNKDRAKTLRKF